MKWKQIKHLILALFIVLSLFLSVGLWTAGGESGEEPASGTNQTPVSLVERTEAEVFSPYQVALHGADRASSDLALISIDEVHEIIEESLEEMSFNEIDSIDTVSREAYQDLLAQGSSVEFVYDDLIPFGLFEEHFDELSADIANRGYNRLAVNLNEEAIQFYDTVNEVLYQVESDPNQSLEFFDSLMTAEDTPYVEAETVNLSETIAYLPTENIEVEYRDYIVERLPNSPYVSELFEDTSEVDVRTAGNEVRYIDLTTEVRVNQLNNTLTYLRQRADLGEMNETERFEQSFQQLERIENWTGSVRFHSYDSSSNLLTFQRYIDGLPIYSYRQQESSVEISVVENGLTHLQLPLRVVQTPLALSGSQEKEMLSSVEVQEMIQSVPELSLEDIDNIRIGLTWEESEEDSQVVHFEPDWYVEIDDSWRELERFVEHQEGGFDGF